MPGIFPVRSHVWDSQVCCCRHKPSRLNFRERPADTRRSLPQNRLRHFGKRRRSDATSAAMRQGCVVGVTRIAWTAGALARVAARNAQGRGPAGRRPQGAWERRAGEGAWGRRCGLAPCTGMVTCFTVRESRSKAVADAIRLARSCSQKVPGCTVNKAMGPPPRLERAGRTAHGVWTPSAKARTARHNTLIGWTPTRRRSGAPSRTSLTFFGVSPRDAGNGLQQPPGSSRRHHSAAIGITACSTPSAGALETPAMWSPPQGAETKVVDSHQEAAVGITAQQSGLPLAALHPLALWKRQSHPRPRKVRRRKSLTATRSSRHLIVSGFSPKGPNPLQRHRIVRRDESRPVVASFNTSTSTGRKSATICLVSAQKAYSHIVRQPQGPPDARRLAVTNHSLAQKNRSKLSR